MTNRRQNIDCRTAYRQFDFTGDRDEYAIKPKTFGRGQFAAGVEKQSGGTGFVYGSENMCSQKPWAPGTWSGLKSDNSSSMDKFKLQKRQKEVEEDLKVRLMLGEERKRVEAEETRKDLQVLKSYNPWGKPAGGAPRTTKSGTTNAHIQRLKVGVDSPQLSEELDDPYGKPGAGAPLRSKSGKVQTHLKENRDIRFQQHLKTEVPDSLRYKPESESENERRMSRQQQDSSGQTVDRVDSEKLKLIKEQKRKVEYARRLEEQCLEALDRQKKERQELRAPLPRTYLWGKNSVNRDKSGNVIRRKWVIDSDSFTENTSQVSNSIFTQMGKGGCGAPIRGPVCNTHASISRNGTASSGQTFYPWGKPGAGARAPLRDQQGDVKAIGVYGNHTGKMEKRSDQNIVFVDKMEPGKDDGLNVASQLRTEDMKRPAAYPHPFENGLGLGDDTSLLNVTTMATNHPRDYHPDLQTQAETRYRQLQQRREERQQDAHHDHAICRMRNKENEHFKQTKTDISVDGEARKPWNYEYSDNLRMAIEEKELLKKRSRENKLEIERKHISTCNQHWGKPGAGAPRLNSHGQVHTLPKNIASMFETQVYSNRQFRDVY